MKKPEPFSLHKLILPWLSDMAHGNRIAFCCRASLRYEDSVLDFLSSRAIRPVLKDQVRSLRDADLCSFRGLEIAPDIWVEFKAQIHDLIQLLEER